jgi:hypothetical protein
MKYKPFTSKHCTPSRFTSPLMQTDAVEKTKKVGKFVAKQGAKQALKAFGQKALATAFGVGGMLLSSQKAYGQGKSGGDIATEEYLKNNPDAKLVRSVEDLQ